VGFAQDHDMIQALPADRADQPFRVSVLPRRPRRRWSVPDTHGSQTLGYRMVRGVSVTDEVSWAPAPTERPQ
jgi:hypothetical protein